MTEVALALAMAFFSLMVLTMVSMGAQNSDSPSSSRSATTTSKMTVALSSKANQKQKEGPKKTTLVVFWNGTFLDRNLQPFNPEAQKFEGRVILALPPELPMGQALEARAKIKAGNLVVSALNDKWLDRLSRITTQGVMK